MLPLPGEVTSPDLTLVYSLESPLSRWDVLRSTDGRWLVWERTGDRVEESRVWLAPAWVEDMATAKRLESEAEVRRWLGAWLEPILQGERKEDADLPDGWWSETHIGPSPDDFGIRGAVEVFLHDLGASLKARWSETRSRSVITQNLVVGVEDHTISVPVDGPSGEILARVTVHRDMGDQLSATICLLDRAAPGAQVLLGPRNLSLSGISNAEDTT